MTTYLTRFAPDSTDGAITSGTATYTVGDAVMAVRLECFEDALNIDRMLGIAATNAKRAQARYLRGAVTHLIDDAS